MAVVSLIELARAAVSEAFELPGNSGTVMVRALEGWEQMLLIGALPQPEPPKIPDPSMGSLSKATIEDWSDPKYLDAFERWQYRYQLAYAAAASGHMAALGSFDQVRGTAGTPAKAAEIRAWCEQAAADLASVNYIGVIKPIYMRSLTMGAGGTAAGMERAEKN